MSVEEDDVELTSTRDVLKALGDSYEWHVRENTRLRAAFNEIVKRFEGDPKAFTLKHCRCSWCGEVWPQLDGEPLASMHEQTKRHADICPKNDIRIERDRLRVRRDELLALVAQISQTVPLDSEVADALRQRGAMLAEIGTLKARVAELEFKL